MTPDSLARIGRALYGEDWISPMARALGVSRRNVHRWLDGKRRMMDSRVAQILALLRRRAWEVATLAREIDGLMHDLERAQATTSPPAEADAAALIAAAPTTAAPTSTTLARPALNRPPRRRKCRAAGGSG